MSIPISQKVDLLYKQAFGVTKTDTEANKSPSNESIASPLLNRGDTLWSQSDQIPGIAASVAGLVQAYTGAGAQECVADNTTVPIGGVYPTWKTNLTYWIPAEFGSTYSVSVWVDDSGVADPTSTGTQVFGAGSGGTGEFFYNYQSGVLNFIGETIPTALTSSKVLYIVGYRYIGLTGVTSLPDGTQIGNLVVSDQTITGQDTNANIVFTPDGSGQVVTSGNVTASYFYGNGAFLSGIDTSGIANGTSNVSIPVVNGNINLNVNGILTANITDFGIVATGTGSFTGNLSGANLNTGGVVSATGNVSGGNLTSGGVVEVTGNVIGGNITTVGVVSATGNVSGGNITTSGEVQATGNGTFGNVNGGNLVLANYFTGTLIDGTSNITVNNNGNVDLVSAGNTTVVITGTGANIVGTVNANGVATFGSVVSSQVTAAAGGNLTLTAGSTDQYVEIRPTGTGQVHVGGFRIESLGTPSASTDAATKQYVDDVAQGLSIQAPAVVASTDTYAVMSTGTVTYDNGTAGVGATLTTTVALTDIDGITLTTNDRIIIKDEANSAHNGIYVYTSSTVLTRATDFDTPTEMAGGDFCFVQQGTLYNDTGWVMTDPVTTIGTSNVTWVQFSGAGTYTAGAGLTLTGTQFSVNTDGLTTAISGGNVVVKTSAQLTTPNIGEATGTSLVATGNVSGGNLTTVGIITATGNILGGNVYANAGTIGASLLTGTLTTAAQPNITSVGTLTSLTVNGNTSSGNLSTGGVVVATGNVTGGNITTGGVVDATGNVSGGNITTGGVVDATGNVSGANLTSGGVVEVTGNVIGGNITTVGLVSATGNVIGGNITTGGEVVATGNVSGANLTSGGVVEVTGNVIGGNITTVGVVDATGNVIGGNITTVGLVSATGNVSGGNITTGGEVVATGNVTGDNLFSNAITVNNDASLNTANFTGNVGFSSDLVTITNDLSGNTANFTGNVGALGVLTDNLYYANGQPWDLQEAAGSNTQIQYNNNGDFGASSNFTFDSATNNLSVSGNIVVSSGTFSGDGGLLSNVAGPNVTGQVGNALVSGTVYTAAQPNITSVGTLTSLAVTGNVTTGNVSGTTGSFTDVAGSLTTAAQPNITSVGTLTSITSSGDANIAGVVNVGASEISTIGADSVTTTAITSDVIAQFPVAGLNGVEFIVKSIDSTGSKYGVATVLAVTDGTNVDFSIYGQAFLGATTGTLSVAISGANIALSTTPASSNSTVWTTQYRSI